MHLLTIFLTAPFILSFTLQAAASTASVTGVSSHLDSDGDFHDIESHNSWAPDGDEIIASNSSFFDAQEQVDGYETSNESDKFFDALEQSFSEEEDESETKVKIVPNAVMSDQFHSRTSLSDASQTENNQVLEESIDLRNTVAEEINQRIRDFAAQLHAAHENKSSSTPSIELPKDVIMTEIDNEDTESSDKSSDASSFVSDDEEELSDTSSDTGLQHMDEDAKELSPLSAVPSIVRESQEVSGRKEAKETKKTKIIKVSPVSKGSSNENRKTRAPKRKQLHDNTMTPVRIAKKPRIQKMLDSDAPRTLPSITENEVPQDTLSKSQANDNESLPEKATEQTKDEPDAVPVKDTTKMDKPTETQVKDSSSLSLNPNWILLILSFSVLKFSL